MKKEDKHIHYYRVNITNLRGRDVMQTIYKRKEYIAKKHNTKVVG